MPRPQEEKHLVMRITEDSGEVSYMAGEDENDATDAFGDDIEIEYGYWTKDPSAK